MIRRLSQGAILLVGILVAPLCLALPFIRPPAILLRPAEMARAQLGRLAQTGRSIGHSTWAAVSPIPGPSVPQDLSRERLTHPRAPPRGPRLPRKRAKFRKPASK